MYLKCSCCGCQTELTAAQFVQFDEGEYEIRCGHCPYMQPHDMDACPGEHSIAPPRGTGMMGRVVLLPSKEVSE